MFYSCTSPTCKSERNTFTYLLWKRHNFCWSKFRIKIILKDTQNLNKKWHFISLYSPHSGCLCVARFNYLKTHLKLIDENASLTYEGYIRYLYKYKQYSIHAHCHQDYLINTFKNFNSTCGQDGQRSTTTSKTEIIPSD